MRHEKKGWGVLDIAGAQEFKALNAMPRRKRRVRQTRLVAGLAIDGRACLASVHLVQLLVPTNAQPESGSIAQIHASDHRMKNVRLTNPLV